VLLDAGIWRSGAWTPIAPRPPGSGSAHAVQARGGRVVVTAGPAVDVWDPADGSWTRIRPEWPLPQLTEEEAAEMRAIEARYGGRPKDPPTPTSSEWKTPVAMADGTVVVFLDCAGEFSTSLGTMAWVDPDAMTWSDPIPLDGVAQLDRSAVALPDGRLVTTGWSPRLQQLRCGPGPERRVGARRPSPSQAARSRSRSCPTAD
jgi:hypothetical protein